jgi:Zn-dependent protease
MLDAALIQTIAVYALPVLFAITLHEAAHGYIAKRCGDNTAYLLGRITLNPLKHIDLVGTVLVPIAIVVSATLAGLGPFLFGWAKPVPVVFGNLRRPMPHMRYVALAGPAANFLMALLWGVGFKLLGWVQVDETFWLEMCKAGVSVNLVFAALNLLPILPLDGGRVVYTLLPRALAHAYSRTEPYGTFILIGLLMLNVLPLLVQPLVKFGWAVLALLLGF